MRFMKSLMYVKSLYLPVSGTRHGTQVAPLNGERNG
jgi:hypothetical protein